MNRAADHLTVFYYGCCLPVANGGAARLADLLDRLVAEFDSLTLYSYADHPDLPWCPEAEAAFRSRWPSIALVLERYGRQARQLTRLKNLLLCLLPPSQATGLLRFAWPGATPRWDAIRRRGGAVVVSYTEGLTQLNGVDPARCLVETHDVNFVKWSKMHGRRPVSGTALRKLRGEVTALEQAHAIVAISAGEAAFFRMVQGRPVAVVPQWRGAAAPRATEPRREAADYDLVFVGSAYVMNVRGFCALLAAQGTWLVRYRIAVCDHVADDPAVRAAAAGVPSVSLLGFVDDLDAVYRRSRAALSPVDGTGTKMKVLQALSAGLPVFASGSSREGLPPGHEDAVFDLTERNVERVLGTAAAWHAASRAAGRYAAKLQEAGEGDVAVAWLRALLRTGRGLTD